ncbi:MAG TPA: cyanophycinase [Candidatus Polarisedimenticolaceae bacterium]|nr:cyanophycinase [Candidatus Polarisedimenticolaceae bacterium]
MSTPRRIPAVHVAAFMILAACSASSAAPGPLVLVGGGLDESNEPVYREILGLRAGPRPICVLPTASDEPQQAADRFAARFERYGGPGTATVVRLKPGGADKPKIARRLEQCGGFFFLDGDPSRIVDTLRGGGRTSLAEQAILRVHRRGGVIAGSNAAAAAMSDPMIAGETGSDDALRHGVSSSAGEAGLWVRDGMGFLDAGLTDPHHISAGRTGRLLVALAALDGVDRGFGIDDDTALVVDGTRARVVGSSQAIVVEKVSAGSGRLRLAGARFRVLVLGNGDGYHLDDRTAFVDAGKNVLRLPDRVPTPPDGPWLASGLPLFLVELSVSSASEATFESRGFRFRLSKEAGFEARAWELPDGRHLPHGFTAGWFLLDVSEATP